MYTPWTHDGRMRADVVNMAAGKERFRQALAQAEALAQARKAELDMRHRQAVRRVILDSAVASAESREDTGVQEKQAKASYDASLAALETARLNLRRSEVCVPVDGNVTNLNLHAGDYVSADAARMALIGKHSYWVYG